MAVGVVLSFFQIFTSGLIGLIPAIVGAALAAYFFVCIYSLYEETKNNSTPNIQTTFQTTTNDYQKPQVY